eukprot:5817019-Amphidinium_carterae.1
MPQRPKAVMSNSRVQAAREHKQLEARLHMDPPFTRMALLVPDPHIVSKPLIHTPVHKEIYLNF